MTTAEEALLRELAEEGCDTPDEDGEPCWWCWPCRAKTHLEENDGQA